MKFASRRRIYPALVVLAIGFGAGAARADDASDQQMQKKIDQLESKVEALEALGIDPVHYLVLPRVIGMALGVFALTVYFIIGALLSESCH